MATHGVRSKQSINHHMITHNPTVFTKTFLFYLPIESYTKIVCQDE